MSRKEFKIHLIILSRLFLWPFSYLSSTLIQEHYLSHILCSLSHVAFPSAKTVTYSILYFEQAFQNYGPFCQLDHIKSIATIIVFKTTGYLPLGYFSKPLVMYMYYIMYNVHAYCKCIFSLHVYVIYRPLSM